MPPCLVVHELIVGRQLERFRILDGDDRTCRARRMPASCCVQPHLDPEAFKLAADYQFVDTRSRRMPMLRRFRTSTALEFTEAGRRRAYAHSSVLGGPARFPCDSPRRAIAVNAQGTASATQILRFYGETLLRHVSGAAAWQGSMTGGRGGPDSDRAIAARRCCRGPTSSTGETGDRADAAAASSASSAERLPGIRSRCRSAPRSRPTSSGGAWARQYVPAARDRRQRAAGFPAGRASPLREFPYADADRWRALFGGKDGAAPRRLSSATSTTSRFAALDFAAGE